MKDLLSIKDSSKSEVYEMFADTKRLKIKNHNGNDLRPLLNKTIITDAWPPHGYKTNDKFSNYQINLEKIGYASNDCIVKPCPTFTRGEEISEEIINSDYFIGYKAKENLLHMQKTILMNLEDV